MAISRITSQDASQVNAQGTAFTSITATYPVTPTQGNLLIATMNSVYNGRTISGWTRDVDAIGVGGQACLQVFHKIAGASESTSVTSTFSSDISGTQLVIYEYSGNNSLPFDKVATDSTAISGATSVLTGTVSTTSPNELLFVAVSTGQSSITSASWSNSFSIISAVGSRLFTAQKIVLSAGSYSSTATLSSGSSNAPVGAIVTFTVSPPTLTGISTIQGLSSITF